MKRCQCKTLKGKQCTLNASTKSGNNQDFCDRYHQKCVQVFAESPKRNITKKRQPKMEISPKRKSFKSPKKQKCQCVTNKGKQCTLDASTKPGNDSRFCDRFHQKCKNSMKSIRKSPKITQKSSKITLKSQRIIRKLPRID